MTTTVKYLPLVFLAAALQLAVSTSGQTAPSKDLSCIEDLKVPIYQNLAQMARASGNARAVVSIGENGLAGSISIQGNSSPIITAMVRSALETARFSKRCVGQSIEINFVYRLDGKPSAQPRNQITFRGPNTFEVVSSPPVPQPTEPADTGFRPSLKPEN